MLDRLLSVFVSLTLAFLVWLYARSRDQDTLDNVPVPVQIVLAPGQVEHYDLEILGTTQVPFSFQGPPSRIREVRNLLQSGDLRVLVTLSVPENRQHEGRYSDTVRVQSRDLQLPPGVTPTVLEGQNRIPVTLHRLVERRLPVRSEHTSEARITQVAFEPATVLVRGPEEVLDRARTVPTQNYVVPARTEPSTGPQVVTVGAVPLADELEGRRVRTTPAVVKARVTLQPQQKVHELTDVQVQFLCPPNFALRPLFGDERAGKITLRLLGPALEEPPVIVAYIDLSGRNWEPGLTHEELLRIHLPKDFQFAQPPPRSMAFQLVNPTATTRGSGIPDS